MTAGRTTLGDHSVLVQEVLRADGSRGLTLRVFCSQQAESVPLETCEACPRCTDIAPDVDGVSAIVRCEPRLPDGSPGRPVGALLHGATLCVRSDVEIPALLAFLAERDLPGMFVVDDDGRLVGLVRDVNLLRALWPTAAPQREALDEIRIDAIMSSAPSVEEDASVRRALLRMASAHLREIPVVSREGRLVGVVRDVDALLSIATKTERGRDS